jgi:hypothetical protein
VGRLAADELTLSLGFLTVAGEKRMCVSLLGH